MTRYRFLFLALALLGAVAIASACRAAERDNWLTGDAFRQQLALPATVLWAGNPLRSALLDFGRTQRIAVLLDRRVDPDQKLELALREEPVLTVIQTVAKNRNLAASLVGNVVYVGPPASAARIRTVAALRCQELESLGPEAFQRFADAAPVQWRDLDTPRQVLDLLADAGGIEIAGLDQVPHDLWAAADLPPLTLNERLTLVLEQFDLTYQIGSDGQHVALRRVPPGVALVRDYPGGSRPEELIAQWRITAPRCEFRLVEGRIYVRGLIEDHELLEPSRRASGRDTPTASRPGRGELPLEKVYTADVPNKPLGVVLHHFASQLGFKLEIDDTSLQKAGVSLQQLISFKVKDASIDQLFEAVLEPVGCVHQREGNLIKIHARL